MDVFVFSHSTGQPVAGATARLFSDENEPLREAVTDAGPGAPGSPHECRLGRRPAR